MGREREREGGGEKGWGGKEGLARRRKRRERGEDKQTDRQADKQADR